MTSRRAAALFGTIFGSISSLLGLAMILASGIGLLILPWTVTTLVSGLTVRGAPERALSMARFAVIWAGMSSLVFAAIAVLTFDIGLSGIFTFWVVLTMTVPLIQWLLCRRVNVAVGGMAGRAVRRADGG
jgi:hypothetical protein